MSDSDSLFGEASSGIHPQNPATPTIDRIDRQVTDSASQPNNIRPAEDGRQPVQQERGQNTPAAPQPLGVANAEGDDWHDSSPDSGTLRPGDSLSGLLESYIEDFQSRHTLDSMARQPETPIGAENQRPAGTPPPSMHGHQPPRSAKRKVRFAGPPNASDTARSNETARRSGPVGDFPGIQPNWQQQALAHAPQHYEWQQHAPQQEEQQPVDVLAASRPPAPNEEAYGEAPPQQASLPRARGNRRSQSTTSRQAPSRRTAPAPEGNVPQNASVARITRERENEARYLRAIPQPAGVRPGGLCALESCKFKARANSFFCQARHFTRWYRAHAPPPVFDFDPELTVDEAYREVYPDVRSCGPGEHDDYEALKGQADEWVTRFMNAVSTPYRRSDWPDDSPAHAVYFKKQQEELNGSYYDWRHKTKITQRAANVRMRLLWRSAELLHIGGAAIYPGGGDNYGYGNPAKIKFSERLALIEECLRHDKRLGQDIIEGRGNTAFVENPTEYARRKLLNSKSNFNKKQNSKGAQQTSEDSEAGDLDAKSEGEDDGGGASTPAPNPAPAQPAPARRKRKARAADEEQEEEQQQQQQQQQQAERRPPRKRRAGASRGRGETVATQENAPIPDAANTYRTNPYAANPYASTGVSDYAIEHMTAPAQQQQQSPGTWFQGNESRPYYTSSAIAHTNPPDVSQASAYPTLPGAELQSHQRYGAARGVPFVRYWGDVPQFGMDDPQGFSQSQDGHLQLSQGAFPATPNTQMMQNAAWANDPNVADSRQNPSGAIQHAGPRTTTTYYTSPRSMAPIPALQQPTGPEQVDDEEAAGQSLPLSFEDVQRLIEADNLLQIFGVEARGADDETMQLRQAGETGRSSGPRGFDEPADDGDERAA